MSTIADIAQRIAAKACAALQDIRDGHAFPEDVYREIENDTLLIRQMFHGPVDERYLTNEEMSDLHGTDAIDEAAAEQDAAARAHEEERETLAATAIEREQYTIAGKPVLSYRGAMRFIKNALGSAPCTDR